MRGPVQHVRAPHLEELDDLLLLRRQRCVLEHPAHADGALTVFSRSDVALKGQVREAADGDGLLAGRSRDEVLPSRFGFRGARGMGGVWRVEG